MAGFQWRRLAVVCGCLLVLAVVVGAHDARRGKVRGDFARYSLAASRTLYEGGNPYEKAETGKNYKYFPLNAVLLGPFTKVPLSVAQGLWFALNTGLLVWCFAWHRRMAGQEAVPRWVWGVALVLSFRFLWMNLKMGQWNTSVYCLAFGGMALLLRERMRGAVTLALASVLKYMPAFFLLYLVARRRWKLAAAMVLAVVFWVLVFPSGILGPARHIELLKNFHEKGSRAYSSMVEGKGVNSNSLRSAVYRMSSDAELNLSAVTYDINLLHLSRPAAKRLGDAVAVLVLASIVGFTFWVGGRRRELDGICELLMIGLWFMLFLMISPEVRMAHLLTIFTPVFALAALAASPVSLASEKRLARWTLGLAFVLLTLPAELISETTYQEYFELWGTPTAAIMLLAAVSAWIVAQRVRRGEAVGESGLRIRSLESPREAVGARAGADGAEL